MKEKTKKRDELINERYTDIEKLVEDKVVNNGNKYLKQLFCDLLEDKGSECLSYGLHMDGLEIMMNKILFGNKSSSQLLNSVFVENYGFNEVLSDLLFILNWKKHELNEFNKNRMSKLLSNHEDV
jgi:hypothetical protein